jgi:Flp pilus assembly protein TadB
MDLMTKIYLISGIVSTSVALIVWELSGRWVYLTSRSARRLQEAESIDHLEGITNLRQGSLEYQLMEAKVNLSPIQFYLVALGFGVIGMLLSWFFFIPGLPSLAVGGVLGYLPFGYIQEKVRSQGRKIDEKLAIALSRIAPGLQVNRSLEEVLEEVANSLDAEGSNPLGSELLITAKDIRSRTPEQALRDLAKRSPSLSLANVAMLLESYLRAGGGQYAQVLSETATSIQRILAVRTHAQAKAAQPLQSARLIPLMLGGVLLVMMADPVTRASFSDPLVQVVMSIAIGVMALGYLFMRNEVMKSV